ncbi:S-adenosyl-L-methionine-dependent methyltransferase [Xylaria bambusicola]|uniref:S-adenosyl-L-methionine-dependent methyltransferase n=1 Tax=Xylaria bambusicola TaxID=326684 RepID=UPI002007492E|nr:S-adenosyl-L-methionine-dependent methyltransferase [Xylaria bambusicola]KAI0523741.1 S-adenosyl-L-methionine-dependent methyltransferase [Xylaria bambusicola]
MAAVTAPLRIQEQRQNVHDSADAFKLNGRTDSSDSSRTSDISAEKTRIKGQPIRKSATKKKDEVASDYVVDRSVSPNRLKTFLKAFKHIRDLSPQQVDAFMASYEIYNLDWADEDAMVAAFGTNYQEHVGQCLAAYYSVINHLCSLGDVEKMYIPPLMDKKASVRDNQLLCEESIAREIGLKPGMKVLDLGCGRGRVAAHMTSFSGARVTGLNIDANQVAQAKEFNQKWNFSNEFIVRDQNDLPLPFADESFDAFYEIQALSLCKDPKALFKEIYRILKPGSRFLLMDWVSLPAYDPENPTHTSLMRRVKPLIGAVGTPTPTSFEKALEDAGFTVTRSDNPSIDGLQAGLIDKVDIYFRSVRKLINYLTKLRALPQHFKILFDRLCLDGQAFVEMDTMRLITTTYRIVAEKPLIAQS